MCYNGNKDEGRIQSINNGGKAKKCGLGGSGGGIIYFRSLMGSERKKKKHVNDVPGPF